MTAPNDLPTYTLDGDVAVITMDDGKANVVSPAVVATFNEFLDRADAEARSVLIVGRPGKFSGGFDLTEMTKSEASMRSLVAEGGELLCRMAEFRLPIVSACTGHAVAMGALLLLASDVRVGAQGPFKIGLTEVAIGMPMPIFVVELARIRLLPTELTWATVGARVYDADGAAHAGYLDEAVAPDDVVRVATAHARLLGSYRTGAFARTKQILRGATIAHIRATIDDDVATLQGPTP